MRWALAVIGLVAVALISCANPAGPDDGSGNGGEPVTEHAWHPVLQGAVDEAAADGKLVLMLAGRDACGNCTYMIGTVCESDGVKPVLLENYVTAYIDVDNSTDWYPYAPSGGFTLPLIAIIDPESPDAALSTTTGVRYEDDFLADIQAPLE